MDKKILSTAIAGVLAAGVTMSAQAEISSKFFGFSQITAQLGDGDVDSPTNDDDGLRFGADRIRIGYKLKDGNVFGGLQVDFLQTSTNVAPNIIKDAYAGYKFNDAAAVKLGVFKTPVGMDFNTSGKALDITKRGMEKGLVLERAAGAMLSGRKIGGGFGYDIGVFNPTTRSSAVDEPSSIDPGQGTAWAGRVMYDMGDTMHVEASYGVSPEANGVNTDDYTVWDIAGQYKSGPITVKGEYISGSNVRGSSDWDQTTWYLHGGYKFNDMLEGVIRYYSGTSDKNGNETDLQNTYIGLNVFAGSTKYNGRLQLNYVIVGGDDTTWTGVSSGKSSGGYTDDVFLAQYQVAF